MAFILCEECNGKISDKTIHCPHCGYVYHRVPLASKIVIAILLIAVLFIMSIIVLGKYF